MTEPSTARCPNHDYGQVTFTCVRCGTSGCEACRGPVAGPLCATCGAQTSARGLPVVKTLQESFQFLLRRPRLILAISPYCILFGFLQVGLSSRHDWAIPWLGGIFSTLIQAFVIRYVGNQWEDSKSTLAEALGGSFKRLLPGLGANLLTALPVYLGLLAFVFPALILYLTLYLTLCLALPAVVLHDVGVVDALKRSWNLTRPYRLPMGGLLLLNLAVYMALLLVGGTVLFVLSMAGWIGAALGLVIFELFFSVAIGLATTVLSFTYLKLAGGIEDAGVEMRPLA